MVAKGDTHFPGPALNRRVKKLPVGTLDRHTIHFRAVFPIEFFDQLVKDYMANSIHTTFSAYLRELLHKGLHK